MPKEDSRSVLPKRNGSSTCPMKNWIAPTIDRTATVVNVSAVLHIGDKGHDEGGDDGADVGDEVQNEGDDAHREGELEAEKAPSPRRQSPPVSALMRVLTTR